MNKIVPPLDDTTKDHVEQPEKSAETLSHRVSATYLSPITPNPLERLEARARVITRFSSRVNGGKFGKGD